MNINFYFYKNKLYFSGNPDVEDINFYNEKKGRMNLTNISFSIPKNFSKNSIHPDALALLALVTYGPFTKFNFNISWKVSAKFATAVEQCLKLKIKNIDNNLQSRVKPNYGIDSLAFSGGVDSTVALKLLPINTISIFMNRVSETDNAIISMYKSDAAIKSCNSLKVYKRECVIVDSSMEYIRNPTGFGVDWTVAAGSILLCEYYNLQSVNFGMVQESAFKLGHTKFSDLKSRSIYSKWYPLFECINLPLSLPTCGLSEIVTSRISQLMSEKWYPSSCVRGTSDTTCGLCFKCYRKKILDAKISLKQIDKKHFEIALKSKEVKNKLLKKPIHHENVLAYSLHNLNVENSEIYNALIKKVKPLIDYTNGLSVFEKFNTLALEYIPDHLKNIIHKKINELVPDASQEDLKFLREYDINPLIDSKNYIIAHNELSEILS